MADARRQVRDGRGDAGATAIAALQGNKIDLMSVLDATPERKQAVDFPEIAAALLLAGRAGARRPRGEDLGRPQQAGLTHRRARRPRPIDAYVTQARAEGRHPALPRQCRGHRGLPDRPRRRRVPCSIRRCSPRARSSARAASWCRLPAEAASSVAIARATPLPRLARHGRRPTTTSSDQTQKWYEALRSAISASIPRSPRRS